MKIYWSYKSIPEFNGVSKELRKIVYTNACIMAFKQWSTYASIIVAVLVPILLLPESWGAFRSGLGGTIGSFLISQQVFRNCPVFLKDLQRKQGGWKMFTDTNS
ncbi:MAG: hypothetical protein ACI9FG_002022 [Crocinitomicaceae bacterium]|jgi:hypothetical protein